MNNDAIITGFYTAFASGNAEEMIAFYHDDIIFYDPAFGKLVGNEAKAMWRMLIQQSNGEIDVQFSGIKTHDHSGTANWVATYTFSRTGRKVVNRISSSFEFKDGKIIRHTDYFDLWKWSRQALGMPGVLFGWTQWMQAKIRRQCLGLLKKYMAKPDRNLR
jgi:ketosteroid isomerase-like protein